MVCRFEYGSLVCRLIQWPHEGLIHQKLEEFRHALEEWINTHPKNPYAFAQTGLGFLFNVKELNDTQKKKWYRTLARACMLPPSKEPLEVRVKETKNDNGPAWLFECWSVEKKLLSGAKPYLICTWDREGRSGITL